MKYCNSCKVNVNNPVDVCPLCFSSLSQKDKEPEYSSYPDLVHMRSSRTILKALLVLSIAVAIVSLTVNIINDNKLRWSLIVICNIAYMWASVAAAIQKRSRVSYNILLQVLSLTVLLIVVDRLADWGNLALTYVIPLLVSTAILSLTVIMIVMVNTQRGIHGCILHFLLICLLGIALLPLAKVMSLVLLPALATAIYSWLSIVGLVIFARRATGRELLKRFHI